MHDPSIIPIAILVACLLIIVSTPLFKLADAPPINVGNRVSALDGLRGYLALAVFFHHASLFQVYERTGAWGSATNHLDAALGPFGVSMFFMITGFLFWGQVTKSKPNWGKIYLGRVFRIGPLYLTAVLAMAVLSIVEAGKLKVSPLQFAMEVVTWLPLGVHMGVPINKTNHTAEMISVIWSLRYEWIFYLSLLPLWLLTLVNQRIMKVFIPIAGFLTALLAIWMIDSKNLAMKPALELAHYSQLFAIGMISSSLRGYLSTVKIKSLFGSIIIASLLIYVLIGFETVYEPLPTVLIGVAFLLITTGVTLFNALTIKCARRLGNISYGLYLLQLLIFSCIFATPTLRKFNSLSVNCHWLLIFFALVLLAFTALFAHVIVERPGIIFGQWLSSHLLSKRSTVAASGYLIGPTETGETP